MIAFDLGIRTAPEALVTLNQLRTFLAVADNESVRGAAQDVSSVANCTENAINKGYCK